MRRRLTFLCLLIAGALSAQQGRPSAKDTSKPLVQLQGMVTDSITGKPVYDSLVGFYSLDGKRWAITPVNSDGLYSLFIPAGIPFELRVEQENGYREMRRKGAPIPAGSTGARLDLALQPK